MIENLDLSHTKSLRAVIQPPNTIIFQVHDNVPEVEKSSVGDANIKAVPVLKASSLREPDYVKMTQEMLDIFATQTLSNSVSSFLEAPKLGYACYAFYAGQPVSVLLRTSQRPILDNQRNARIRQFASKPRATQSMILPSTLTPSCGKTPSFDKFAAQAEDFSGHIKDSKAALDRIDAAAKQADEDFAIYEAKGVDFYNQFGGLLDSFDSLLGESLR